VDLGLGDAAPVESLLPELQQRSTCDISSHIGSQASTEASPEWQSRPPHISGSSMLEMVILNATRARKQLLAYCQRELNEPAFPSISSLLAQPT
jgi:hypothetical protein